MSQCEVGETRSESFVHGGIMWGVTAGFLLSLAGAGISNGFGALMRSTSLVERAVPTQNWQELAEAAGVPREQIDLWMSQGLYIGTDAEAVQEVRRDVTASAWWAFAGTLLSIFAAIGGAVTGAGPRFRLVPISMVRDARLDRIA